MKNYKVVIAEDEPRAAKRLHNMLMALEPNIQVVQILDSVESSVEFFEKA